MLYRIDRETVAIKKDRRLISPRRRTRQSRTFQTLQDRPEKDVFQVFPRTVRDWNALPPDVPEEDSLCAFKMDVLIHKKHPDELIKYLFKVYQEKTLCDTVIHTPDGGAFQVHKIVVTASSTYLHNVLSQANQIHSSFSVDVRAEILQVLLEYMYTGQLFVSQLTRDAVWQAATYLQIYSVIDLLKETAVEEEQPKDSFSELKHEDHIAAVVASLPEKTNDYDSDNTIVDDNDIAATFNNLNEVDIEAEKGRKKHPRKQKVTSKRMGKSHDEKVDYTAIKEEKLDESYEKTPKSNKTSQVAVKNQESDSENQKHMEKSQGTTKSRRKNTPSKSESEPLTRIVLRSSKRLAKKKSKSKERSRSKKRSKKKFEFQEPIMKLKVKTEKVKVEEPSKVTMKGKKVLNIKDGDIQPKTRRKRLVKIKMENDTQKTMAKHRRVVKPCKKKKCACRHCDKKFPGFVFLRRHLLNHHKENFVDDWQFSRYLIRFYSGISRYIENCTVDISGHKNKYKCAKCKKAFTKYSLHCLHFKRHHMISRLRLRGKFFTISRKLKSLENLLKRILQKSTKLEPDQKLKATRSFGDSRPKKIKTEECSYCHKKFVSELTLKVHQKKMHGVEPPRKYRIGVAADRKARESTKLYQCSVCEKYMVSQYALQKHLKDHHKLDDETARHKSHELTYDLNCEVISCGFKTRNLLQMKNHVLFSHPFIQHPCSECKSVFQVRLMLERHKLFKHSFKPPCNYMCAHCEKRFPKQFRLKVHEFYKHGIEHPDIKIYRCDSPGCQYVTASLSSLRVHGSKHLKDKPYTCEFCGMKLKTPLSHQKHINKMHLGIRPYLCQVCGQSFGEDHELKSHIRNKHTTECDFQCEHCPYATTNKGTFYTHLYNVHKVRAEDDKRKEFRCPHPGCKFVSILHHRYQTHLNGHTNTRTYCCKPCNKWFVSSSTLRAHKQWYHSDKVHSCAQCNYQTKTSQKLNEHVRVQHQLKGLKPFKCPYCEFRCATGGNTRKHVKQVHRGKLVTYLRDDQILNAAKVARASGQNQPLINIMPAEALNASVPRSYPASAKKLGLLPEELQGYQEMSPDEQEEQITLVQTKMEEEHVQSSTIQIPEPQNQMILSAEPLEQVSPDPRTQGPVDLGAQVTVDLHTQLPADLHSQLSAELRSQIPADLRCQITTDLRGQLTADLRPQVPNDIRNQLSEEHAMQLATSGHPLPFSAAHYIPAVPGGHHIPLSTSHHLMPMMVAPQVPVSAGTYEEVKDNPVSNLTIIG